MLKHVDVLIIGAGISGIGAAYHLQKNCPNHSYTILEGRDNIGGTWDLFRYPGIRSDSDMYTLGYAFKPWTKAKAIADGPSILDYLRETVDENNIEQNIRFGQHVNQASWSSDDSRWTISFTGKDGETRTLTSNFLFMCSGYYDYESGYTPDFPGAEEFSGEIAHPQKWTEDIDYTDKNVVVIGSGATAVTLVPELAKKARNVTMLQRSPTYMVARPEEDAIANWLRRHLPAKLAYGITRWKNVLLGMYFFRLCRSKPERAKKMLLDGLKAELDNSNDIKAHFTPSYNPWDQRLCLVPNGDLFAAVNRGDVSIVTDHIKRFTPSGLSLKSGEHLDADLIVTATGLNMQFFGRVLLLVDGKDIEAGECMTYKGMMIRDIPNLAFSMGYTNASWTLKCDLTCEYVCRLLNKMQKDGMTQACPRLNDPTVTPEDIMDFSSGYVTRAAGKIPQQGSKAPWKLYQNYALDIINLRYKSLEDDAMEFSNPPLSKDTQKSKEANNAIKAA